MHNTKLLHLEANGWPKGATHAQYKQHGYYRSADTMTVHYNCGRLLPYGISLYMGKSSINAGSLPIKSHNVDTPAGIKMIIMRHHSQSSRWRSMSACHSGCANGTLGAPQSPETLLIEKIRDRHVCNAIPTVRRAAMTVLRITVFQGNEWLHSS